MVWILQGICVLEGGVFIDFPSHTRSSTLSPCRAPTGLQREGSVEEITCYELPFLSMELAGRSEPMTLKKGMHLANCEQSGTCIKEGSFHLVCLLKTWSSMGGLLQE